MKGIFLTADAQAGQAAAKALWDPVLAKLASYAGMKPAESKYYDYPDFKSYFDARFGAIDCPGGGGGHEHKLRKRHGEMTGPMGIIPMDSRLLGQSHLTSPQLAAALKAAMPQVPDGQLRGHLVGGGKVLTPTEDTSVLPAWRKCKFPVVLFYHDGFLTVFASLRPSHWYRCWCFHDRLSPHPCSGYWCLRQ